MPSVKQRKDFATAKVMLKNAASVGLPGELFRPAASSASGVPLQP